MQFAMVPLNLMGKTGKADYARTGNFANNAHKEAKKYGEAVVAASSEDRKWTYIPSQDQLTLSPRCLLLPLLLQQHHRGHPVAVRPETGSVPLVCDMSSDIMSRPIDVSKYGIIYAGAQKNLAPRRPDHRHHQGRAGRPRDAHHPPPS